MTQQTPTDKPEKYVLGASSRPRSYQIIIENCVKRYQKKFFVCLFVSEFFRFYYLVSKLAKIEQKLFAVQLKSLVDKVISSVCRLINKKITDLAYLGHDTITR